MPVDAPGLYLDFPVAEYHADPAPLPSLSQSIAKILLERSPLHAWHAHPRLSPTYEPDDATKYDVGNVAHALLIGRGKNIAVLDFEDWRTKAAKEAREQAAGNGVLAVLAKHHEQAQQMVAAARLQLSMRGLDVFSNGDGEVMAIWQEGPTWFRQLIDWLTPDRLTFADYKTTKENAAPHMLGRKMAADGWPIQAAMAERGLNLLHPEGAGRRRYLFVVQEDEPPYALTVAEITEGVLTLGRKRLQIAVDIWAACCEADDWPCYPSRIVQPEMPGWVEQEWLDREIQHAAAQRVPISDALRAG